MQTETMITENEGVTRREPEEDSKSETEAKDETHDTWRDRET